MLVITRKVGESIIINDNIKITIRQIKRGSVRIGIQADKEVKIDREEIYKAKKEKKREINCE